MTSPPPLDPDPATGPLAITPAPQRRRYASTGLAVVTLMAATAAATYAVTIRTVTTPAADAEPTQALPTKSEPTPEEATAAKDTLCAALLQTTKGSTGRGGVVTAGELNTVNVVRILASTITIQRAATTSVAPELANLANAYMDAKLGLANAALANEPIGELVRLTDRGNEATRNLADACGLPY